MTIRETPLAPDGIYREFEAELLSDLKRHNATMHGCPVRSVECKIDGSIAIWFAGQRDGQQWRGALRFNFPLLHQKELICDTAVCAEVALGLLDEISLKKDQPMLIRASAA